VLAPLIAPALLTAGIFAFVASLNEYLFALAFTTFDSEARTVPLEIARMLPPAGPNAGSAQVMAASVIVSVPLVAFALLFHRRIIAALATISTERT